MASSTATVPILLELCFVRIEDQEHPGPASEKDVAAQCTGMHFQTQHSRVKLFCCFQILCIDTRLEHSIDFHHFLGERVTTINSGSEPRPPDSKLSGRPWRLS